MTSSHLGNNLSFDVITECFLGFKICFNGYYRSKLDTMNTRSLEITPDILRLISDIDDFRASWRTMKNLVHCGYFRIWFDQQFYSIYSE